MIDQFKSLLSRRGGLSMANRFDAIFTLPPGVTTPDRGRDLTLLCESASLPGRQITTMEWAAYGHHSKIPTGFILDDVTLTFNVTNDYYVKKLFDEWQELVIGQKSYNLAYDSEFKTDMIIRQLDSQNKPVFTAKLAQAYPITVNSISLDQNSENTIQKLVVTVSYTSLYTDK